MPEACFANAPALLYLLLLICCHINCCSQDADLECFCPLAKEMFSLLDHINMLVPATVLSCSSVSNCCSPIKVECYNPLASRCCRWHRIDKRDASDTVQRYIVRTWCFRSFQEYLSPSGATGELLAYALLLLLLLLCSCGPFQRQLAYSSDIACLKL
jgi:hypothetical protein